MEIPELGKRAAEERTTEDKPAQVVHAESAFMVYIARDVNGQLQTLLTTDLDTPIVRHHVPTLDEVLGAASVVVSDITAQKTGQATVQIQMMHAQQAIQQQQTLRVQQELEKHKRG